jgi:hypothetical protein
LASSRCSWARSASTFTGNLRFSCTAASRHPASSSISSRTRQWAAASAPVVEYTPRNAQSKRFESQLRSYPPRYKTGDRVTVIYNDSGEKEEQILNFQELWLPPILIGILAFSALLFAAICFWAR